MVRRHVLAALAAGIEAADHEVARAALARIDWILRGRARRRLEAALLEAAIATGVSDYEDPASVRHVLRAAALIVRGDRVELADRDQVTAALETRQVAPPATWPVATIVAGAIALATATTVAAATAYVVKDHAAYTYDRPAPPPPVGVFRDGGAPQHDAAIERALGDLEPLVATSAAITHGATIDESRRAAALATLRGSPAFDAHGATLGGAWRDMLDAWSAWASLMPGDPGWSDRSADLRARIDTLSDQLAAAELGYYVDPEILGEHPRRGAAVRAYRIEDVAFVRANDNRVRVLDLRGLARGGAGALLGLTAEEIDDPVVLLDSVDQKVATQLLPVLAGASFSLGDSRLASSAAGNAIRRELLAALYTDVESADKAIARTRQLVVASVRHHEAQHKLDKAEALAYPLPLARLLPERKAEPFAVRARYELSAYLSQIASDVWLPQLTLWSLARHAFHRGGPRSEEQLVAVVVVEEIAKKLGIPSKGPVVHGGEIDRDRLAALVGPISVRTTVELRSAAAAVWAEMFEAPLVRLYD